MDRPIEEYLKHADELAQEVVNTWGMFAAAGHGNALTAEMQALFEKTCRYRGAKRAADNHRHCNVLTEEMVVEERHSRLAFALAYKTVRERHEKN